MPSTFEAAWAARQSDLTARFIEPEGFDLVPMAAPTVAVVGAPAQLDGNGRRTPDAGRVKLSIDGIFIAKGSLLHAHGRSMADSTTRPVVADTPVLIVQTDALPQPIVQGDVIVRRRTGDQFRVTKVVPQQFGRGYVHLEGRT